MSRSGRFFDGISGFLGCEEAQNRCISLSEGKVNTWLPINHDNNSKEFLSSSKASHNLSIGIAPSHQLTHSNDSINLLYHRFGFTSRPLATLFSPFPHSFR